MGGPLPAANGEQEVANGPGGGGGFGSGGGGGGGDGLDAATHATVARMEERHEDELKRMRGEVARLRMSNELMAKDLTKLKAIVGTSKGAKDNFDVDELASKTELEALRAEVGKLRRQAASERDAEKATAQLEIESLRRELRALEVRVRDGALDDAMAQQDMREGAA